MKKVIIEDDMEEDEESFDEDDFYESYVEDDVFSEPTTPKGRPKKKSPKDKEHYVNSKLFKEQIEEYYRTNELKLELTENLRKIAEGLGYSWHFIQYTDTWKSEMVGDAYAKMLKALISRNFDLDKKFSPFSYFNKIAWIAFTTRIKREKKRHQKLQEYKQIMYEQMMTEGSHGHIYVKPVMEADENDDGWYDD